MQSKSANIVDNKTLTHPSSYLSKVNKSIYKTGLVYNPISLLEKSAITGRIYDAKEPKPKKKPKVSPDKLSAQLKLEHKNENSIKIYQLPKLPFGSHKSYNEEIDFLGNHFKFDDGVDDMSKNLEFLTRKFRLNDKNNAKRAKSSHFKKRKNQISNYYCIKMDSGYLVCRKESKITDIYDDDKARYHQDYTEQTFREVEGNKNDGKNKGNDRRRKIENDVVQRLFPVKEDADSPIMKMYKSKYSAMFSEFEPSTRPVTSFQVSKCKSLIN